MKSPSSRVERSAACSIRTGADVFRRDPNRSTTIIEEPLGQEHIVRAPEACRTVQHQCRRIHSDKRIGAATHSWNLSVRLDRIDQVDVLPGPRPL